MKIPEKSPFGSVPFSTMSWLYFLAIPSLALMFVSPRPRFLLVGFLATLGAFCAFRLLGIAYGDRYVFFMAFFAQVLVAEAAAIGLTALWNRQALARVESCRRVPRSVALLFALVGIAGLIGSFYAPPFRAARANGTFPYPVELWKRPNAADAFYANYGPLRPYLSKKDIVLVDNSLEGYALATTTGARSVVVVLGFYVPDYTARARDVERFLSTTVNLDERRTILNRYNVSHILLLREDNSNIIDEIKEQFGPPLFEDERLILFSVERNRI